MTCSARSTTASPWNRPAASSRRIPENGRRASPIPEPGKPSRPSPPACASRSTPADSRRTGLITWPQIDDLLGPGLTPARRQIVVQASQIRMRFAAANASFRAVGEGRLAAAAEDELRAHAAAAVTAILTAARPAGGGQAPQPADEAATIERIAELAAALPSQPPQPRAPAGQVTTGAIIGHPGYRFQPFRVSAPPRHTDAADRDHRLPHRPIRRRARRADHPHPDPGRAPGPGRLPGPAPGPVAPLPPRRDNSHGGTHQPGSHPRPRTTAPATSRSPPPGTGSRRPPRRARTPVRQERPPQAAPPPQA